MRATLSSGGSENASLPRDALRRRIEKELLGAGSRTGERLPSARELARRWGADFSTVARAMHDLVLQGRLEKSGYKYTVARPGAGAFSDVTVHSLLNLSEMDRAMSGTAKMLGLHLEVVRGGRDFSRLHNLALEVIGRGTGGLILRHMPNEQTVLAEARRMNVPVVFWGRAKPGMDWVCGDNREAGRLAVAHLHGQGHRELAYVGSKVVLEEVPGAGSLRAVGYAEGCRELGLSASEGRRLSIARRAATWPAEWMEALGGATAAVCETDRLAISLIERLKAAGREVPGEVSVVSLQESPRCRLNTPAVTSVCAENAEQGRLAVSLLHARVRREAYPVLDTIRRPMVGVSVAPAVLQRASSGPGPMKPDAGAGADGGRFAGLSLRERRREVRRIRDNRYEPAGGGEYRSVSLRAVANRGFTHFGQWLGALPLSHFPPGRALVHGVPFDILEETSRSPRSCLVLAVDPGKSDLSRRAVVPVRGKAAELYFLHGAGFVSKGGLLATYQIHLEDGTVYRQPVRCLGPEGAGRESATGAQGAHIQDWWADYPHFQNENARMVLVAEDDDPLRYERYLYTLRWVNPRPAVRVRQVEIEMGALKSAKLGLLAITRALVSSDKKGGSGKGGGGFVRRGV